MFRISPREQDTLAQHVMAEFEHKLAQSLRRDFPAQRARLQPDDFKRLVKFGIQQARRNRLSLDTSISEYLYMMLMFGHAFDADPQLPWAHEVLANECIFDEELRIDYLRTLAQQYRNITCGSEDGYLIAALSRAAQVHYDMIPSVQSSDRSAAETLGEFVRDLYPEKWHALRQGAIADLTRHAENMVERYGLASSRAIAVCFLLMFFLGVRFDTDPQFPWASDVFENAPSHGAQKDRKLFDAARIEAQRTLALLSSPRLE